MAVVNVRVAEKLGLMDAHDCKILCFSQKATRCYTKKWTNKMVLHKNFTDFN